MGGQIRAPLLYTSHLRFLLSMTTLSIHGSCWGKKKRLTCRDSHLSWGDTCSSLPWGWRWRRPICGCCCRWQWGGRSKQRRSWWKESGKSSTPWAGCLESPSSGRSAGLQRTGSEEQRQRRTESWTMKVQNQHPEAKNSATPTLLSFQSPSADTCVSPVSMLSPK